MADGISRTRRILGLVLLAGGLSCAVMTATVLDGAKLESQSIAAEGAILSSLGLALLAPVILRAATGTLGPILRRVGGAPAQLGLLGIRQRIQSAATPLMPIIVCTAIATGTIYMQSIWNSRHSTGSADDKNIETLNYVVVGMIAVFAAVMLVNLLVAEMTNRRREFAQLRLIGSTPEPGLPNGRGRDRAAAGSRIAVRNSGRPAHRRAVQHRRRRQSPCPIPPG